MSKPAGNFAFGSDKWPGVAKVIEEMAELGDPLGKLVMLNGENENLHWTGDLRPRIVDEAADTAAAIEAMKRLSFTRVEQLQFEVRKAEKLATFLIWHTEQKQ